MAGDGVVRHGRVRRRPEQGWAQAAWLGTTFARRALAMALTGMMLDGEIKRDRAEQLARMVMHENAIAACHLRLE